MLAGAIWPTGMYVYFSVHTAGWGLSVGLIRSVEQKHVHTSHPDKVPFPLQDGMFQKICICQCGQQRTGSNYLQLLWDRTIPQPMTSLGCLGLQYHLTEKPKKILLSMEETVGPDLGGNRLKEMKTWWLRQHLWMSFKEQNRCKASSARRTIKLPFKRPTVCPPTNTDLI